MVDRKVELGFSFIYPSKHAVEALFALGQLKLEKVPTMYFTPGNYEAGVEIRGVCHRKQDVSIAQAVLKASQEAGNRDLIRRTVIIFEDLSERELLKGGGVKTVVHQIAIRSLIQGIEED